jgi:hypothetical protein
MTARSHETIRVGLRRIIRDDSVSPKVRMEAIQLLMRVEGLLDEKSYVVSTKNQPGINHVSDVNDKKLKELLALPRKEKSN